MEEAVIMPLTYPRENMLIKPWVNFPSGDRKLVPEGCAHPSALMFGIGAGLDLIGYSSFVVCLEST
jgi:hypothetical protein